MSNHTDIPGTELGLVFLFLAPYARTTRYGEVFCLKAKNGLVIMVSAGFHVLCTVVFQAPVIVLRYFCFLLLFEQFVVVRIRFFVYDSCHSFVFALDFLFAHSSSVVFLVFNARGLLLCAWVFVSYPVGWHDVALFTLPSALQCSISTSNCCDRSVRISVECRISTDTECVKRRRPILVYHEEHGVEAFSVG